MTVVGVEAGVATEAARRAIMWDAREGNAPGTGSDQIVAGIPCQDGAGRGYVRRIGTLDAATDGSGVTSYRAAGQGQLRIVAEVDSRASVSNAGDNGLDEVGKSIGVRCGNGAAGSGAIGIIADGLIAVKNGHITRKGTIFDRDNAAIGVPTTIVSTAVVNAARGVIHEMAAQKGEVGAIDKDRTLAR